MGKRTKSNSESEKEMFTDLIEQHRVDNITIDFFYQPHTLTLLIGVICGLIYIALFRVGTTWQEDFFHGGIAVCVIFLFMSTLFMPNGPFTRPHPVLWRVIFGLSLLYFLSLVVALFMKLDNIRQILHWMFPELASITHGDILDKEYAVNCSQITFSRFYSHFDGFALAHFLGWFGKTILLRHYPLAWTLSINWEITEIAFCHMMPNFCECWWDSILLDVIICNGLGIYLGMKVCSWLEMRSYEWESFKEIRSAAGKMKRAALQFTPESWISTSWFDNGDERSTMRRGMQISLLIIIWQFAELNSFFLKYIFIVLPSHPITLARLALITFMSAPGIRQYYLYVTKSNVKRVGSQLWLFLAVVLTELIIAVKFGQDVIEKAVFQYFIYWIIWLVISSILMVFLCLKIDEWRRNRNRPPSNKARKSADSKDTRTRSCGSRNGDEDYTVNNNYKSEHKSYNGSDGLKKRREPFAASST